MSIKSLYVIGSLKGRNWFLRFIANKNTEKINLFFSIILTRSYNKNSTSMNLVNEI